MSYWDSLPPTPAQLNAIKQYNHGYGIELNVNSKQDAHDVISQYCPKQMLFFTEDNYVEGTNISFKIVDSKKFTENPYNKWAKKHIKNVRIENGVAHLTILKENPKQNTNDLLLTLQKNMDERLEFPSYDKVGDNLGFLSEEQLDNEMDIYGHDPMWWE